MTPSQFDAQVESWTAKQADFDASLRQDRAFVQLTRQRETSRRSRGVRGPAPTHERVQRPDGAPCRAARGPRGRARSRCTARATVGGRTGDGRGSRVGGRDVSRCRCQSRGSGAPGASSRDDAAGRGGGGRAGHRLRGVRARRIRDASRGDFSRRKRSRLERKKRNRAAKISTDALETPARVSPPPPPSSRASPTGQPRPLSRPPDLRIFADDTKTSRTPRRLRLRRGRRAAPCDGTLRLRLRALRRSLAMGKLRRAVSSRANARLREVNAAANEAPTPEVARRVKTRLDPSDVLAWSFGPSRLSWPRRAARRARTRAPSRAARGAGAAGRHGEPGLYRGAPRPRRGGARGDHGRAARAASAGVPGGAAGRGLRVAAANAAAPFASAARAPSRDASRRARRRHRAPGTPAARCSWTTRARSPRWTRASPPRTASTRRAPRTSAGSGTPASPSIGARRTRRAKPPSPCAARGCGARSRGARRARDAGGAESLRRTESKENDVFVFDDFRGDNDGHTSRIPNATEQHALRVFVRDSVSRRLRARRARRRRLPFARGRYASRPPRKRRARRRAARAGRERHRSRVAAPIARKPNRTASAENKPPRTASTRCPSRVDARRRRLDAALNLWVLRSACDLAYRAFAACGDAWTRRRTPRRRRRRLRSQRSMKRHGAKPKSSPRAPPPLRGFVRTNTGVTRSNAPLRTKVEQKKKSRTERARGPRNANAYVRSH